MIPEHRGIFMHILLKPKLHELSADQIDLSPEKQKPSANANKTSVYTSDELSQGKLEKIYEISAQVAILKVPLRQSSIDLTDKSNFFKIHKQRKSVNWFQSNLHPQRLLEMTNTDIKHQDPISLAWFTMHEEPFTILALYLHTAYMLAKTLNLIMAKESEFTAHKTSLSFPADDVNMQ